MQDVSRAAGGAVLLSRLTMIITGFNWKVEEFIFCPVFSMILNDVTCRPRGEQMQSVYVTFSLCLHVLNIPHLLRALGVFFKNMYLLFHEPSFQES